MFLLLDGLTTEAPAQPRGSVSSFKRSVLADTGHIPLTGVRGRLPSLPWILTAGSLSDSERRPLFPEAFRAIMMCLWAAPSSFMSNESPSIFISCWWEVSWKTTHLIKNEQHQSEVNPQARSSDFIQYFISFYFTLSGWSNGAPMKYSTK